MRTRVGFLEDKAPDMNNVTGLLERSRAESHWTNFGPVWHALQRQLIADLALPPGRIAVPCASGTHALMAAAALAEAERELRWITPAFSFPATAVGAFAGSRTVDCAVAGDMDTHVLEALGMESFDGVVALNPFALRRNVDDLVAWSRSHGKVLVIDNAAAFDEFDRFDHSGVYECLSLHHTKPYGFGEGGCLIVDTALEGRARDVLNFGQNLGLAGSRRALSNGKLSEPAAAFILDRLLRAEAWTPGYRRQLERIRRLAKAAGFTELRAPEPTVLGNLPLIAPYEIPESALESDTITLHKYYPPLGPGIHASRIFRHIVNFPCHSGVAALDDAEVTEVLVQVLERAEARRRQPRPE